MIKVIVQRRHPGHPWIFSNEIIRAENANAGDVVRVEEQRRFIGTAFYNPHSLIALRLLTEANEEFNEELIRRRILQAVRARAGLGSSGRLVYSESDGLPGLIVDQYAGHLVLQVNCQGMEKMKDAVIRILQDLCSPPGIYEKSDSSLRRLENLEPVDRVVCGEIPARIEIEQDGLRFLVDVRNGQKTGFFFDQRANRRQAKEYARGEILDAFCYTGGFALYAARQGNVLGIDAADNAIALARENARLNDLAVQFANDDAITALRRFVNEGRTFDTIILDPPSFTKSRKKKFDALRGYKEINLRAIQLLRPGGRLITSSCSYHITRYEFLTALRQAAADTRCRMLIRYEGKAAPDHPVLLGFPESDYLKTFFLEKTEPL